MNSLNVSSESRLLAITSVSTSRAFFNLNTSIDFRSAFIPMSKNVMKLSKNTFLKVSPSHCKASLEVQDSSPRYDISSRFEILVVK